MADEQLKWPDISILRSHIKDSTQSDLMVSKNNKFLAKIQLPNSLL